MQPLLLLAALVSAISTPTSPNATMLSAEKVISLPVAVNIGLLGFAADGAWQMELQVEELDQLLQRILPERNPSCGPSAAPLNVVYKIEYNTVVIRTGWAELSARIAAALRPISRGSDEFEVEVETVEDAFDTLFSSYFTEGQAVDGQGRTAAYTILILNPSRPLLAKQGKGIPQSFSYRYRYQQGLPSPIWLSSSRYLVIDLAAGPSGFGRVQASTDIVSAAPLPTPGASLQGGEQARLRREKDPSAAAAFELHHTHFVAQLAATILSAVRHVFVPDSAACQLPFFGKLIVPLVVLCDHEEFDPLQPGHPHSIELSQLRQQLQRLLLPNQQLLLLPSTHHLHAHPQISVAVSRAHQADTVQQQLNDQTVYHAKPLLDASRLADHMHHTVEWLASGLLDAAATEHLAFLSKRRNSTQESADAEDDADSDNDEYTRVLPLYVFSLLNVHPDLTLGSHSLVYTSADAMIVLQTNSSALELPFTSGGRAVVTDARKPTRHILAGLATAVGNVMPPFESLRSSMSSRVRSPSDEGALPLLQTDLLWATGRHPFGPFSNSASFSQVVVDAAQRHAVISRLHAAERKLHAAARKVEELVTRYVHPSSRLSTAGRTALARQRARGLERQHEMSAFPTPDVNELEGIVEAEEAPPLLYAEQAWSHVAEGVGELLHEVHAGSLELSSKIVESHGRKFYALVVDLTSTLQAACDNLRSQHYAEAYTQSNELYLDVISVAKQVDRELPALEARMACCQAPSLRTSSWHGREIALLFFGSIALCALTSRLLAPMMKPDRRKKL